MIKKKIILPCPSRWCHAMRLPLRNQDGVEKWATGSTSSNTDVNGNQNRQCSNLGPSDTTSTKAKPKKRQKWSREEYKEILYCFYCALEKLTKTCSTERTNKLWCERNKTEREYIEANKLANVRRDVYNKKKR